MYTQHFIPAIDNVDVDSINAVIEHLNSVFSDVSEQLAKAQGGAGFIPRVESDLDMRGHRILNVADSSRNQDVCSRDELTQHALYSKDGKSHNTRLPINALGGLRLPAKRVDNSDFAVPRSQISAMVAGSAAPLSAAYVTIGSDATLTSERALTGSASISVIDSGANNPVTLNALATGIDHDLLLNFDPLEHFTEASILHGNIGGLGADDHTLYLLADGSREVGGSLRPSIDSTFELGSTAKAWSVIYGDLIISNGSLIGTIGAFTSSMQLSSNATPGTPSAGNYRLYSDSGNSGRITIRDPAAVDEVLVGETLSQALTNKTLTAPLTSGLVSPTGDAADDLGSVTKRYKDAHLSGDVVVDGAVKTKFGSTHGVRLSVDGGDIPVVFGQQAFSADYIEITSGWATQVNLNTTLFSTSSFLVYPHGNHSQASRLAMRALTRPTFGNFDRWAVYANGQHYIHEVNAAPATVLTANVDTLLYLRNDKLILKYDDAGTTRWKYLLLTGTGVTWVHSTTEP